MGKLTLSNGRKLRVITSKHYTQVDAVDGLPLSLDEWQEYYSRQKREWKEYEGGKHEAIEDSQGSSIGQSH